MNAAQLNKLVEEQPGWVLSEHVNQLNPVQFDYCIRKEPGTALYFNNVREMLSAEQFDFCCRSQPSGAITHSKLLSPEQLDFCCEKEPELFLQEFCWGNTRLNLTNAQIAICGENSPAAALQFGAGRLDPTQLAKFARAAPHAALKYAEDLLDDALFQECTEVEPWFAVKWCADRLTDEELVRHTAGRGEEVRKLLESESSHPLISRFSRLYERLDRKVAVAVTEAIAREM